MSITWFPRVSRILWSWAVHVFHCTFGGYPPPKRKMSPRFARRHSPRFARRHQLLASLVAAPAQRLGQRSPGGPGSEADPQRPGSPGSRGAFASRGRCCAAGSASGSPGRPPKANFPTGKNGELRPAAPAATGSPPRANHVPRWYCIGAPAIAWDREAI